MNRETKLLFIKNFKEKLTGLVKGHLTRKFKRDFPLNQSCSKCNTNIKGTIRRMEKVDNNFYLIIFVSDIPEENKGYTTLTYDAVSTSIKLNEKYYCYHCSKNICQNSNECPICLENIENNISTKCNHNFCLKCIIKWIQLDNQENSLFQAKCPICRSEI